MKYYFEITDWMESYKMLPNLMFYVKIQTEWSVEDFSSWYFYHSHAYNLSYLSVLTTNSTTFWMASDRHFKCIGGLTKHLTGYLANSLFLGK
jgi:hypothetical protein